MIKPLSLMAWARNYDDALPPRNLAYRAEIRQNRLAPLRLIGVAVVPPLQIDGRGERERRRRADSERCAPERRIAHQPPRAHQREREQRQRQSDERQPLESVVQKVGVVPHRERPAKPEQRERCEQKPASADERKPNQRNRRRRGSGERRRDGRLQRLRLLEIVSRRPNRGVWHDHDARAVKLARQEVVPLQQALRIVIY